MTSRRGSATRLTARHLLAHIDRLTPLNAAPEWDNVGLIAGELDWPATRIMTALDLLQEVADEAVSQRCQALVLYHPPIFKPTKRIGGGAESPTGRLSRLLGHRIAVFAVHTALDIAIGGTNDALLDAFEITRRTPLESTPTTTQEYKLVVFAPPGELAGLRIALARAGAGRIGEYSECSFAAEGEGSFQGSDASNPAVGRRGKLEFVREARLEMIVPARAASAVVRALYATHSYEEPAFDLYPLHRVAGRGETGLGRIGELAKPQRGRELIAALAKRADLSIATCVGDLARRFTMVCAAAGSFGVEQFRDRDTLYITGEFKHHDAISLLDRGVCAVALGHDASERPAWMKFTSALRAAAAGSIVYASRRDRSPFAALAVSPNNPPSRVRR